MAKPNWYNENSNRAFPFQTGTAGLPVISSVTLQNLPDSSVVDCGFIMGLQSGFVAGQHAVQLHSVQRAGSSLIFTFTCDAPALAGRSIQFTRTVGDDDYAVEYTDCYQLPAVSLASDSISLYEPVSQSLGSCDTELLWSGYLVTGDLSTLTTAPFLASDGIIYNNDDVTATIEDSLIQNMAASYVSSITLLNKDRTRTTIPEACSASLLDEWDFPTGANVYFITAKCLVGDIRFISGYNISVLQNTQNNNILFAASPGDGAGQVCSQTVPLFPGEAVSPAAAESGLSLLEGGPHCNQVVRTINGIGGPFYFLTAGTGVQITPQPDVHEIIIDINMRGLAVCSSESLYFSSESV